MKIIGPFMIIIGLAGLGFSIFEFLTLDFHEEPKYFWMSFAAMPIIFVGFILTMPAIQRKILRENEGLIKGQSRIIGEGFKEGFVGKQKYCTNCGHSQNINAKFCSECGASFKNE
ncbi:hypothetical protein GCM10008967_17880 [Bacillus carboniphilus]|uniref:Zinc-ribbon domain-containing protein n=1 Tax=Bacillus carboniphilus TaxID=86663 RepID=A0ABN0W7L7_9BACI